MKVLVTGGSGFLGQSLIAHLLNKGEVSVEGKTETISAIVAFDQTAGSLQHPKLSYRVGDIGDLSTVQSLVDDQTQLIVHLAAVVSGTAEANFDLGMRVNLDGMRLLLDTIRALGHQPVVLFASSVAVFGGALPDIVLDGTTPTPQGSYGIQKFIGEQLVQDYSRKAFIDGRSVRIPTVVVRPGAPNGAASGFASGIIREPLRALSAVLPVPDTTRMWIASPRAVVSMLMHAIELEAHAWGLQRSINLPGMSVSMRQALDALQQVAGQKVVDRVVTQIDPAIVRLVSSWPAVFNTDRAIGMGFKADTDFMQIIRTYINDNPAAIVR